MLLIQWLEDACNLRCIEILRLHHALVEVLHRLTDLLDARCFSHIAFPFSNIDGILFQCSPIAVPKRCTTKATSHAIAHCVTTV